MVSSLLTGRSFSSPKGAAERFAYFIDALRYLVWTFGRSPEPDRVSMAMACLTRAARRWAALFARYQAGTLRPPRRRIAPRAPSPSPPRAIVAMPRTAGWLQTLLPEGGKLDVRCLWGGLRQAVESDPETMAFLAAAPQAGRILRPLMRMLSGAPLPAVLRLPPRQRAVAAQRGGAMAVGEGRVARPRPRPSRRLQGGPGCEAGVWPGIWPPRRVVLRE